MDYFFARLLPESFVEDLPRMAACVARWSLTHAGELCAILRISNSCSRPPTFLLALLVSCFAADACRNFSYDCSSTHIVLHLLYTSAVKRGTFVVTCYTSFHVSFFTGKEKRETDFKLKERVFILSTSIPVSRPERSLSSHNNDFKCAFLCLISRLTFKHDLTDCTASSVPLFFFHNSFFMHFTIT